MDKLPEEIVLHILNFLPLLDLLHCIQVNKLLSRLAKEASEYDYMFLPKVRKFNMIIGRKRKLKTVYLCDWCSEWRIDEANHYVCKKCKRLFCYSAYPNNKDYCIKCSHDLKMTFCRENWNTCKYTLHSLGCLDKGCQRCDIESKDYFYYNANLNRICHKCYEELLLESLKEAY